MKILYYSIYMLVLEIINIIATYKYINILRNSYRQRFSASYTSLALYSIANSTLIIVEIFTFADSEPIIAIAITI